ncbi:MAG: hypothetical protein FJW32_24535 [Acidobacteria bacterium]|nr:hypothetical protein [Acidobacteriota bacterium]
MKPFVLLAASIAWAENAPMQFTFTFTESSPTKGSVTRKFETIGTLNEQMRINAGERVPVRMSDDKLQFVDVGVNIFCRAREAQTGALTLDCNFERSAVAPGQQTSVQSPRIHTTRTGGNYVVKTGASTQLARIDDPITGSQIQIDALIAKLP